VAKDRQTQPSARERILDAAGVLFSREGFHAVGIDTITAESGVAKMTLYRHFPSKDALIAAYLNRVDDNFWRWLDGLVADIDRPLDKITAVFEGVSALASSPEFLGCSFQMAALEFRDRNIRPTSLLGLIRKHSGSACWSGPVRPDFVNRRRWRMHS